MERKRQKRVVIRGVGLDVSEDDYLQRLDKLEGFVNRFDPNNVYKISEVGKIVEEHASEISAIIRATGKINDILGADWIAYTPTIETDKFRAALLRDLGIIEISMSEDIGFDDKGRPLGGFELRLPDGSGSSNWRSGDTTQLVFFDSLGHSIKQININKPRGFDDLRVFSDRYKRSALQIIEFAKAKNNEINTFSFGH